MSLARRLARQADPSGRHRLQHRLRGCIAALACLPAFAAAADSPFASQDDWHGSYTCGSRTSLLALKIGAVDSPGARQGVQASFTFGGDNLRPLGSYNVSGDYDSASRTLTMAPRGFFSLPPGYLPVGFSARLGDDGVVLAGRINQAGCGALTLIRGRTEAPPPRPLPPPEPPPLLPVASVPLLERFTHQDPGVLAALALACPERAQVLTRLLGDRRADAARQAEALVALAGIEARRDCQAQVSYATQRFKDSDAPQVRAARRAQLSEAAYKDRLRLLDERREWLALWPASPAARSGTPVACSGPLEPVADAATARRFEQDFEGQPLWMLFWARGQHLLRDAATCTRSFPDGQTQELRIHWPALIDDWRRFLNLKQEGPLQAVEMPLIRSAFELISADLARQQQERSAERDRGAAAADAERRRQAEERAKPTGDRR